MATEQLSQHNEPLDRANLDRQICAVTQKLDEIKGQVYETINKHFNEYTVSFDAVSDMQEELQTLTEKVAVLKENAKVSQARVQQHLRSYNSAG
jgi:regulator of replication initiation timing